MRRIFIAGAGRCGSTHLANQIGKAVGLAVTPESPFKSRIIDAATDERRPIDGWTDPISRDLEWRRWSLSIDTVREGVSGSLTFGEFHDHIARCFAVDSGQPTESGYVEHWPGNLLVVDHLRRHYPDAEIVHLVRDPRAVVNSLLSVDWGPVDAEEGSHYWLHNLALGLAAEACYGSVRVRYEDYVGGSLDLSEALGGQPSPVSGLPADTREGHHHQLARKATDVSRITAWKLELSLGDQSTVERTCGIAMDMLGYARPSDRTMTQGPAADWLSSSVVLQLLRPYRRGFNRLKSEARRRGSGS